VPPHGDQAGSLNTASRSATVLTLIASVNKLWQTQYMGPFEDRIRAVTGVGGLAPSTERFDEPVHSLDPLIQVQRLNSTVAALVRAIVALQTAAIEIAAELDRINNASR
jgi:hypothetical protein